MTRGGQYLLRPFADQFSSQHGAHSSLFSSLPSCGRLLVVAYSLCFHSVLTEISMSEGCKLPRKRDRNKILSVHLRLSGRSSSMEGVEMSLTCPLSLQATLTRTLIWHQLGSSCFWLRRSSWQQVGGNGEKEREREGDGYATDQLPLLPLTGLLHRHYVLCQDCQGTLRGGPDEMRCRGQRWREHRWCNSKPRCTKEA